MMMLGSGQAWLAFDYRSYFSAKVHLTFFPVAVPTSSHLAPAYTQGFWLRVALEIMQLAAEIAAWLISRLALLGASHQ